MKKHGKAVIMAIILGCFSQPVQASDPSVELGEKLFKDPTLGGSTYPASCSTCHPGGQGLEAAGAKPNLREMINLCIERPLKGKKLAEDSVEMESLILYIQSLHK